MGNRQPRSIFVLRSVTGSHVSFWKSQGNVYFLENQGNLWEIAEHLMEIWKMSGESQGFVGAMADFSAEHVKMMIYGSFSIQVL